MAKRRPHVLNETGMIRLAAYKQLLESAIEEGSSLGEHAAYLAELMRWYGLVRYDGVWRNRLDALAATWVNRRRHWSLVEDGIGHPALYVLELVSINGQFALTYEVPLRFYTSPTDRPLLDALTLGYSGALGMVGNMYFHRHPLNERPQDYVRNRPRCPNGCRTTYFPYTREDTLTGLISQGAGLVVVWREMLSIWQREIGFANPLWQD